MELTGHFIYLSILFETGPLYSSLRWYTPIFSEVGGREEEQTFKAILGYKVRLRPAKVYRRLSQNNNRKNRNVWRAGAEAVETWAPHVFMVH